MLFNIGKTTREPAFAKVDSRDKKQYLHSEDYNFFVKQYNKKVIFLGFLMPEYTKPHNLGFPCYFLLYEHKVIAFYNDITYIDTKAENIFSLYYASH